MLLKSLKGSNYSLAICLSSLKSRWFASSVPQVVNSEYVVRSPLPNIELPTEGIYKMISKNFPKFGPSTAIIDGISGTKMSYNELDESSYKLSSSLQRLGLKKGDVVCIVMPNCPEYAVLYIGILAAGGVLSTCNHNYTANELAYQFKSSKVKVVATTASLLSKVKLAAEGTDLKSIVIVDEDQVTSSCDNVISYHSLIKTTGPLLDPAPSALNDVAILPYSSGTTGAPKGVMLTNYSVCCNLRQLTHPELFNLPEEPSSCLMGVVPFFHIYGIVVVLFSSLYGGTSVVSLPKFLPDTFLSAIENYQVNIAHIVPPTVIFLAKHPLVKKYNLSSLNQIMTGAAPLGGDMVKSAMDSTGCKLIRQHYGQTESSPVTHMMPCSLGLQHPSSVGHPIRSMRVKVVHPETKEALPPNTEGEIWNCGPNLMKGYLNNEEATRACIDDGWIKTGDIGYYDDNGLFYITDRLKEFIKVKGFQVAPAELEAVLQMHSKISDAAVVGIHNERLGEAPKAFIVKKDSNLSEKEVHDFLSGKVAPFKQLAGGIEFIDEIPKSASGKILRRTLRDGNTSFTSK